MTRQGDTRDGTKQGCAALIQRHVCPCRNAEDVLNAVMMCEPIGLVPQKHTGRIGLPVPGNTADPTPTPFHPAPDRRQPK